MTSPPPATSRLVNPRMQAMIGRPTEEIIGRIVADLFPEGLGRTLGQSDQHLLESGQAIDLEAQWAHPDGRMHDYWYQRFPLVDGNGQCWGMGAGPCHLRCPATI